MLPADERPHPPGGDAGWEESWYFDFVAGDGALGGFVRLALRPREGQAWYWAYLAGPGRPLLVVRDHEVELPRGRALEVRATGLWAEITCETPLDHWSAGLEASGVALDDPAEGWRGERGDPTPVGLDLEWHADGDPVPLDVIDGYGQASAVEGDVLIGIGIGAERLSVQAQGWRTHAWGRPPWDVPGWWWAGGGLADGTRVCASAPGRGWWRRGRGAATAETAVRFAGGLDPRGVPAPATLGEDDETGEEVALTPVGWALVPLRPGLGVARAMCVWSRADARGCGWWERLVTEPA